MEQEKENKGRWVSPNEMFEAAKEMMLKGKSPESNEDWSKVIRFIAHNIAPGLELPVCKIMAKLYNCPLSTEQVESLVMIQNVGDTLWKILR